MTSNILILHSIQGIFLADSQHRVILSRDAPMLWTLSIYLIILDFLAHHNMFWIIFYIIIYTDDIYLRWIIHNLSMGYESLHELAFVLSALKAY